MFSKELYSKFRYLLSKNRNFNEICSELGLSDNEVMLLINSLKDNSIYIKLFGDVFEKRPSIDETTYHISLNKEHIRLALLGDTHLCSKNDTIDLLTDTYYTIEEKNTDLVLHCGDFFDGLYPNIEDYYKCLRVSSYEGQLEYGTIYYPSYSNKTLVVSGNHDDSWYQLLHKEILSDLSKKREDIIYLGPNRRRIAINGLTIDLLHGDILQNGKKNFTIGMYIRNIDEEKRPVIIHHGHTHYGSYNNIYGVRCYRTAAIMHASPYILSKGYKNPMSFYFVDIDFDDNGKVKKIKHRKECVYK